MSITYSNLQIVSAKTLLGIYIPKALKKVPLGGGDLLPEEWWLQDAKFAWVCFEEVVGLRHLRKQRGFSLVELLTTIMLIGLLAGLIAPKFMRARFKALHSACVQNEKNLATALESYIHDYNGLYPPNLTILTTVATGREYISSVPDCPTNDAVYDYEPAGDFHAYTISCDGIHDLQIPGIRDGYPQMVNGQLTEQ